MSCGLRVSSKSIPVATGPDLERYNGDRPLLSMFVFSHLFASWCPKHFWGNPLVKVTWHWKIHKPFKNASFEGGYHLIWWVPTMDHSWCGWWCKHLQLHVALHVWGQHTGPACEHSKREVLHNDHFDFQVFVVGYKVGPPKQPVN